MRTALALMALALTSFTLPAAADSMPATAPAAAQTEKTAFHACPANLKGVNVAQIDCCKGHKGVCGCRAGKIVCCDNTTSTEPVCTCRGDDGVIE
ncbi:MAG: hypothetical protein ACK4UX_02165 [Thiobacillus sp.]